GLVDTRQVLGTLGMLAGRRPPVRLERFPRGTQLPPADARARLEQPVTRDDLLVQVAALRDAPRLSNASRRAKASSRCRISFGIPLPAIVLPPFYLHVT